MKENITIGVSVEYVDVLMQAAKIEGIKARIAGMQATNRAREANGASVGYTENDFTEYEIQLANVGAHLGAILTGMEERAEQERKAGEADPIEGPLAMTKDGVYPDGTGGEGVE